MRRQNYFLGVSAIAFRLAFGQKQIKYDLSGKGVPLAGETDLHKTLKKEACRWLYRMGYRCIAAEVRLKPLGIIDAVGSGQFRPYANYLCMPREVPQVCFIECK